MRVAIIIVLTLLICVFLTFLFMPQFGSPQHHYYQFSLTGCLVIWIPIWAIAYLFIRQNKK